MILMTQKNQLKNLMIEKHQQREIVDTFQSFYVMKFTSMILQDFESVTNKQKKEDKERAVMKVIDDRAAG